MCVMLEKMVKILPKANRNNAHTPRTLPNFGAEPATPPNQIASLPEFGRPAFARLFHRRLQLNKSAKRLKRAGKYNRLARQL